MLPITENIWLPGGTAVWGVLASLVAGAALGLMGGYYGGWLDEIIMRFLDAMMSVPVILLYLIIVATIGASAINVVIAIAIVGAPGIARLVRGLTLDIRTRDYIGAAVTRGESAWHIMFMEILPNARGPVIIDSMLRVGYAIFAMGTLGFLGLGLPPPSPDWGSMVAKGRPVHHDGKPMGRTMALLGHSLPGGGAQSFGRRTARGDEPLSIADWTVSLNQRKKTRSNVDPAGQRTNPPVPGS